MSPLSDCGRTVPLPRLCLGDPLARRSVAQTETERGRYPPATAGLEVTRPRAPGTTEEISAKGYFQLHTNANRLLKKGHRNSPFILGEIPVTNPLEV